MTLWAMNFRSWSGVDWCSSSSLPATGGDIFQGHDLQTVGLPQPKHAGQCVSRSQSVSTHKATALKVYVVMHYMYMLHVLKHVTFSC